MLNKAFELIWLNFAFILHQLDVVVGHARLMEPPSRASMWRQGFNNPADFNDNQGYCGGFLVNLLIIQ